MKYLPLLLLIFLLSCGNNVKLELKPEINKAYSYELSSDAVRNVGEEEESVQNLLKFNIAFAEDSVDKFIAAITFTEMSMLTEGEEEVFGGFGNILKDSLLNNPIKYYVNKQGGIKYPYDNSVSYMEKVNALSLIEDEGEYETKMVVLMTDEIRNGLFTEWIDYLPAKPTTASKWKTVHQMSFMNILKKEQEYEWEVISSDDQWVDVQGSSTIETLDGEVEIGMGVDLFIEFKGKISSNYTLKLEKSTGLIQEGKLTVSTDGTFTRTAKGTPVADQMEPEVESLKGNATTTIKRL
ncbi:MAG: hypothetical protein IPI60_20865 [Saprospiraceae bacterium]|nr:hypothetical protein [Saprospiraceae bacterium]